MKKIIYSFLVLCIISIVFIKYNNSNDTSLKTIPPIKIAWMTSWATTGQILSTLEKTNIIDLYKLHAKFHAFLFGPDMNEAARAGEIDVTNTGVVPTVNLLVADDDWIIVARLIYFNVSLIVPKDSPINNLQDLKSKKIAVPFGGGSHPYMLQRFEENNITTAKLINIKPPEQVLALITNQVDAVATWEPQSTISLEKGHGKLIDEDVHVGFISVRKSYASKYPNKIVKLLKSYIEANYYVSQNRDITDKWFQEFSKFDSKLLSKIKVIEPNVNAKSIDDINIDLSNKDFQKSQIIADLMYKNNLTSKKVDLKSRYDPSFLEEAKLQITQDGSIFNKIQI